MNLLETVISIGQMTGSGLGGACTALGYAKNHLPRLLHYLEDGRIEIDNNQIENKIRPLARGEKITCLLVPIKVPNGQP